MIGKADVRPRAVLVTGASRGIGAGIAEAFGAAGDQLILVARSSDALRTLADRIAATAPRPRIISANLAERADVDRVIAEAGAVDVLVNNAAVAQRFLACTDWPESYWREAFEVGFWAPAIFTREFGRGMAARGKGLILNISSSAALQARPFLAHYSALKAAADMVMRTTAMELGRHGVRAMSIAPGAIATGHHSVTDKRATGSPLEFIAEPADIAKLALFLASEDARYMTGAVIPCDGGTNAGEYSRYEPFKAAMLKVQAEQ